MNARQFYNLVVRMRKAQRDCDNKPSLTTRRCATTSSDR